MKKLLTPFNLLLALFIASFSSAMAIEGPAASKSDLVADFERAKTFSLEYMEVMPADGYAFKPTEDTRSFVGQFLHLANANYGIVSAASGVANPIEGNLEEMEDMQTKEASMKAVSESYDFVIKVINDSSDEDLAEMIKLFGAFDLSRGSAYEKIFEHGTHHRGQATIYLRLKGVTPPNEKLF